MKDLPLVLTVERCALPLIGSGEWDDVRVVQIGCSAPPRGTRTLTWLFAQTTQNSGRALFTRTVTTGAAAFSGAGVDPAESFGPASTLTCGASTGTGASVCGDVATGGYRDGAASV